MSGNRTGGVLLRHAFRQASANGSVITAGSGKYDASCRIEDLYHICLRVGLDLSAQELEFVTSKIDPTRCGFVSSSDLLDAFSNMLQSKRAV